MQMELLSKLTGYTQFEISESLYKYRLTEIKIFHFNQRKKNSIWIKLFNRSKLSAYPERYQCRNMYVCINSQYSGEYPYIIKCINVQAYSTLEKKNISEIIIWEKGQVE